MTENNRCQSISQWLLEDDGTGLCRPCSLGVLKVYYQDMLEKHGKADLARELESLSDTSPESVGRAFDDIKAKVDENTAQNLKQIDCLVQATAEESNPPSSA